MKSKTLIALVLALTLAAMALGFRQLRAADARSILWPLLVKYSETMSNKDLKGHMSCFADRVQWFGKSVTREQLEKQLAAQFRQYDRMSMTLLEEFNFTMTGKTAAVTCRKMWYFCEAQKGKGFCGMTDAKFGFIQEKGEWKINSVQDLYVNWVEKSSAQCCEDYQ